MSPAAYLRFLFCIMYKDQYHHALSFLEHRDFRIKLFITIWLSKNRQCVQQYFMQNGQMLIIDFQSQCQVHYIIINFVYSYKKKSILASFSVNLQNLSIFRISFFFAKDKSVLQYTRKPEVICGVLQPGCNKYLSVPEN